MPPPFDKLGEYVILGELGKGGMGVVYKASQESLDRVVALKVLAENLLEGEEFVKRFVREAKAAAHMVHPNVIQIYSVGSDKGVHYYAMEFVEGDDLSKRLRAGFQPTWEESTDIVMDVAKALSCAEDAGIVHRDIKPANVMIDKRGQVKVMDFGLAKAFTEQTVMVTQPGMVVGTVAYMSPEQGRGEDLDGRADQYSLGVMYYEMLTGKLPFKGDSPTSIIYMHIHEAPPPPRSLNPTIPEAAEQVVLKMLAKKREDRYPNAKTLIEDLKAVKRNTAVGATMMFAASAAGSGAAHEEHTTDKTVVLKGGQAPVKPKKGFVGIGIAAGVLLAGGAGYFILNSSGKKTDGDGPSAPAATPEKIQVDLGAALKPLGLLAGDAVSLEGEPLADWNQKKDLAERSYRLTVKRKYYLPEEIQLRVRKGERPGLSKSSLALAPDEAEVLLEVTGQLAESEKAGNPLDAISAQDAFVLNIFKTIEIPKYKTIRNRHYAYWKAKQNVSEGNLKAAEDVLKDNQTILDLREMEYLGEIRKMIADKGGGSAAPAVTPPDPAASSREFDVSLDFVLPSKMPADAKVFVGGKDLPPGPPWKVKLKPGTHQLVLQAAYFNRVTANLRVGSEGTPSPLNIKWEPDAPAVLAGVQERLGQEIRAAGDEERLQKRLELVNAARGFALSVFQTAGASEITDDGIRRLLDGQEACVRAAIVWRDGKGNAREAEEILKAVPPGSLDREGEDLLRRVRQEAGQEDMSHHLERVRDRVKRGLLADPELARGLDELMRKYGQSPDVKGLQNQVDEARLMLNEVDEMVKIRQYGLAHDKLGELIVKHCPDSSVLKARLAKIEQDRDSDDGAKAQTQRKIAELSLQLEDARRKDDAKLLAEIAARILQLDPAHAQALACKAEAEGKLFESTARAQIDGGLEQLTRLFHRSAGGKDRKEEYQSLFTPEGWAVQVERQATRFFDSPLAIVSTRFDNAVTQVDARAGAATTTLEWAVTARYGPEEISARFPLAVTWKLVKNAWRIDKVEEKAK